MTVAFIYKGFVHVAGETVAIFHGIHNRREMFGFSRFLASRGSAFGIGMVPRIVTVVGAALAVSTAIFVLLAFINGLAERMSRYSWRRRLYWKAAHFWSVIRLRRRVLLLAFVISVLTSGLYSACARHIYGATARIMVGVEDADFAF